MYLLLRKLFFSALALLTLSTISCKPETTESATSPETTENSSDSLYTWFTILATVNIDEATKAVGGEWYPAEEVSSLTRSEDEFYGFTIKEINSAIISDKKVLDLFVKEDYEIMNQYYDEISYEDFLAMPINKIISMIVAEGHVKLYVNDKGYTSNPCTEFAAQLAIIDKIRTKMANKK